MRLNKACMGLGNGEIMRSSINIGNLLSLSSRNIFHMRFEISMTSMTIELVPNLHSRASEPTILDSARSIDFSSSYGAADAPK